MKSIVITASLVGTAIALLLLYSKKRAKEDLLALKEAKYGSATNGVTRPAQMAMG